MLWSGVGVGGAGLSSFTEKVSKCVSGGVSVVERTSVCPLSSEFSTSGAGSSTVAP